MSRFPVEIKNDKILAFDKFDLAEIEGTPLVLGAAGIVPAAYVFDGANTPAANGFTLTTAGATVVFSVPPMTKRYAIQAPTIFSSEPILFDIRASATTNIWRGVINGNLSIPAKFFVQPNEAFAVLAKGKVASSGTKVLVTAGAHAVSCSADIDYNAEFTFYVAAADSNTEGTSVGASGTVDKTDVYTWKAKKSLGALNKSVRLVDKSKAGYTTLDFDNFRKNSRLDLPYKPSLILWSLGTNNPGRVTDSLFEIHAESFINYCRDNYPESILIMTSVIPNGESSSKQSLLSGFRTQLLAKIAAANTGLTNSDLSYVYFTDFYNLWNQDTGLDSLNTQCYTASSVDGVGKLHANPYGQGLMHAALMSVINANTIYSKMKTTN